MTRVYLQDTELTGGTGSNISAEDLRKYFEPYRDDDNEYPYLLYGNVNGDTFQYIFYAGQKAEFDPSLPPGALFEYLPDDKTDPNFGKCFLNMGHELVDVTGLLSVSWNDIIDKPDFDSYQTADQVETAINNKLGSVYRLKGSVAKVANLPKNAAVGDVYNVTDTGMNYVWTGTEWDALGTTVDLSGLSTDMLTNGTLPVTRGGTGITSNPSMLTNLASTTAANVFQASPRPGITGILPLANGGTNTNNTSRNINTVFAGPSSGSAGNASWRKLVAADIPDLDADKITSGYISVYRFPNQIATDVDFFKTSNNCTIVNNFSRTWGPIVSIDYTFKFNANFSWPNPTASTWQGYAPGVSKERDCPQSIATLHVWDVSDVSTVHHIGFAFLNISGSIAVDIPVSQIPTDHTYRINGVYMRRANYR